MKINEYNVSEYTEVVDAPYNHTGGEEVLDERPMGFIKGGLQKLGAKVLPGSYGDRMQGKVEVGQQANQLYKEFNIFLGKSGYESSDDAIKAFLKQKGINVNIDGILKGVTPAAPPAAPAAAPAPAASKGFNVKLPQKAPAPAPVAESIDSLNRILVLSGRAPKKIINENKNILNEKVALDRGALNKIFMQVAQQMSGGDSGEQPAAGGGSAPASAPAAGGGSAPASAPAAGGGIGSRVAGAVKGAINKLTTPTAPKPAAGGGDFGGDSPAPSAGSGSAPLVEPPSSGSSSSAPPVEPPSSPAASAPAAAPKSPASGSPAPAAPGPLGGTKPGAAAAKAAGSQKQSTQNMNDYVKNVSSQINAAQTKPEKIELAKELINFMSDRKGSPEYDNAIGSASAVLKKAGLNNMLAPLKGGQTANQKPQGLRKPAATPALTPTAQPAAAPAETPPASDSAPTNGAIKTASDGKQYKFMGKQWAMYNPANGKVSQVAKKDIGAELNSGGGSEPAPAAPAPKVDSTQATLDAAKAARSGWRKDAEESMYEDARVLHRNSYIFIKKVLENTDLTLRDLGYRVSISESTSDSVTLISR